MAATKKPTQKESTHKNPTGIAIIGGGLIGLCAALVLQHTTRNITLVEATDIRNPEQGGMNARSIALSCSSVQIFRALGLWPQLLSRATPIHNIHVSAQGRWGVTRMRARDYDLDALGYVVDNQTLTQCLLQAVDDSAHIKLQLNSEFESIEQQQSVTINYCKNKRLQCLQSKLVLVADGARSKAREALDIPYHSIDYGQSVVISNVRVSDSKPNCAYERFTSQGPLAMLPLGDDIYACVWTLDPDVAEQVSKYSDAEFASALQDCFGYRLGVIDEVGARFSIPLQRTRAERLHSGRCVLIGNAANALHPVAGQGFNLALRDIACLYEMLVECNLAEMDFDEIDVLGKDYENKRLAEQSKVIRYGDGLVTLFSNELPLVDHLRAAGLSLLDLIPALKTQVALSGMGMTYGGNRLLRGRL
jgi:2-octaprenyl-6-methoxyphenol hydroxylase